MQARPVRIQEVKQDPQPLPIIDNMAIIRRKISIERITTLESSIKADLEYRQNVLDGLTQMCIPDNIVSKNSTFNFTTTTTFIEAAEFLVLSFDRTVVLPPLPGTKQARVRRNNQEIDLLENDTLILPMANGTEVLYTLVGMISHIGSVDSGHIVAHLKYNDRPNQFLLVDDLEESIQWSHLAGPDYAPNKSHLFFYMKASAGVNPLNVVNLGSQSQQDVQEDEEEPPVDKSSQRLKLLVRNQKNPNPLYADLHYLFSDPTKGLGWFSTVLNAIVHTCRESNYQVPLPPKKKHRKRWSFEHYFRELYHLQQGMFHSLSKKNVCNTQGGFFVHFRGCLQSSSNDVEIGR